MSPYGLGEKQLGHKQPTVHQPKVQGSRFGQKRMLKGIRLRLWHGEASHQVQALQAGFEFQPAPTRAYQHG